MLTKTDIAAMKKADSICFYYDREKGSTIHAIKKESETNPFEQRYTINSIESKFTCYGDIRHFSKGFQWVSYTYCDFCWQTFLHIVKPGDIVSFHWITDNNNQYVKDANLHVDQFHLIVKRKEKIFDLMLKSETCPGNTARMVQ